MVDESSKDRLVNTLVTMYLLENRRHERQLQIYPVPRDTNLDPFFERYGDV